MYQAFKSISDDEEIEIGTPVPTQDEAIKVAQDAGVRYFLVYTAREVTAANGVKWWTYGSSYSYCSW